MAPVLILLGLLLLGLLYRSTRKSRALPPGPSPVPLLGNLHQLGLIDSKRPYRALDILSKQYGDIMTVRFGFSDTVILSSLEVMKETLGTEEWSGRIWNEALEARCLHQRLGIMFNQGESWKTQRRFAIRHLRDVGLGKQQSMEFIIYEELEEILTRLRVAIGDKANLVLPMHAFFNISVINVLWTLLAGVRYGHEDPKLQQLLHVVDGIFKSASVGGLGMVYPFLRKIAPRLTGDVAKMRAYANVQDFIRTAIGEHRESASYGDSRDFLDIYLQEIERTKKDDTGSSFTDDQLILVCMDLFVAGSETTSNTLEFAILYMILHPDMQEKVFREIQALIGTQRNPTLSDQSKLPYTAAVLMEVQRLSNVGPLTPPRQLTDHVLLRGYRIPKDTHVLVNLYSVHMNADHWGDPEVFRPDRFLDAGGKVVRDEHLIPFGTGKRICMGDSLAQMSLFLYFTTLLQTFQFQTVPGQEPPSTQAVPGITLSPQPYSALVSLRKFQRSE